jgi:DNA-binding NarL/FixJ family response regulator
MHISGPALWPPPAYRVTLVLVARTIVIVDDSQPFRRSARSLLEVEGYDVVGEAADGAGALEVVSRLQPDVVLLDIGLPDGSGIDIAARLAGGPSRIVIVSSRDPADFGRRLARSGAAGFISKDELSGEALASVLAGAT